MRGRRQAQPFAAGGDKLSPQVQHHAVTFALRTRGTATSSVPNACTACSTRQCHVSCFVSHASCHGDPKLQTLCCMAWLSQVRLCKRADGCAHSLRLVSAHASVPKSRMNAWQQSNLRGGDRRNPPPRDLGCMMLGAQRAAASHTWARRHAQCQDQPCVRACASPCLPASPSHDTRLTLPASKSTSQDRAHCSRTL